MNFTDQMFSGMFGKVQNGLCRLSVNGDIAIKTTNGYKTYNVEKETLVNCNNFVFNIGEEFFFVLPTNKVEKGDIIIASGKPKCVISANGTKTITVMNYEDSTIQTIVPERHMFMGSAYFYGKIVSMFGKLGGKKSAHNKLMKYWMMSQMMGGGSTTNPFGTSNNSMGSMFPMAMMMSGGFGDMFDGVFDFDDDDDEAESDEVEEVIPEKAPAKKKTTEEAEE